MATSITFNGFDFQDAEVITPDIDRYTPATKSVQKFPLSFSNRQKVVASFYQEKTIVIAGTINESSETALQTKLSAMRAALNATEETLAIDFNGLTLNYTATGVLKAPRKNYHVSFLEYEVTFTVVDPPYGIDSVTQNHSNNTLVAASVSSTFDTGGEVEPEPVITLTVNSETGLVRIVFTQDDTATSIRVEPTGEFTAGDVLIINTKLKKVLFNGTEIDFSGRFPEFVVGTNSYTIDFVSTAHDVDLDIDWQDYYL